MNVDFHVELVFQILFTQDDLQDTQMQSASSVCLAQPAVQKCLSAAVGSISV
jgi:hypothetical protein